MDAKILSPYKNIIIGVVIIITFVRIVQGTVSQHFLKRKEVAVKAQELEEGERIIEKWKNLERNNKELTSKFLTKDTLTFKKFVEENANDLGIKITSLKTSNVEKELYWEMAMNLGMRCSYKDFKDFVKAIEDKGVAVEGVTITSSREERDEIVHLALKGFIIKE